MAKTKQQKKDILNSLQDKLKQAKSIIFTSFNGLTVKETELIREELKNEQSEYLVTKKTLLSRAVKDLALKDLNIDTTDGQVAVLFGYQDEVAPARIINKHIKEKPDKISFVGGILEKKYLSAGAVAVLAELPGKQELQAQLVGSINSPISGMVNVLAGNLRSLLYAFNAINEIK